MSLTSYRAAPPRVKGFGRGGRPFWGRGSLAGWVCRFGLWGGLRLSRRSPLGRLADGAGGLAPARALSGPLPLHWRGAIEGPRTAGREGFREKEAVRSVWLRRRSFYPSFAGLAATYSPVS